MNEIPEHARGYEGFGGEVAENGSQSRPWWPPQHRAATDAPNVLVVLVDDMGFSDVAPFGAEIDTPAIQEIADDGYRLTNYHSTPLCSPSRAALITGLNPHRAGFGYVSHADPGYPGWQLEIADDVPTLAESFRAGGYATFMVGKWHLTKESKLHDGADKSSWPCQQGFDRYFGGMDGFTLMYQPHRLVRDNSVVDVDAFSEDYHLTDGLTDEALAMIRSLRANDASKPFFLYFAHHAVHGPVQSKPADIEKYRGVYDGGWDRIRDARFARQLRDELFPGGVALSESGPGATQGVPPWDSLDEQQRRLFARHMEVYAAAVDGVDQSLARIVDYLKEIGEYDNTIIVFTSDNGGTGEGGVNGTRSYFSQFSFVPGMPSDWLRDVPRDIDLIGGPRVHGHYPRGWAHASNTPFRYYKNSAYAGGIHVPMIVSWPSGLPRRDDDRGIRDQYAYVTDVVPTLLSLAGVERPRTLRGKAVKELDGVGFDGFLRDASAASDHRFQYVECGGERGYYEDGMKLISPRTFGAAFTDENWELYDVASDPAETRNLAGERPEVVRRMAERWRHEAWANTVFPLDDAGTFFFQRPSTELALSQPVTLRPGTPTLERFRSSKLTLLRSFDIEIAVELNAGDGGVLVAHGDQGGGYAVVVEDGRLGLLYNAYGEMHREWTKPLAPGRYRILVQFTALPEFCWSLVATAGDQVLEIPRVPQLMGMAPFTGISVGVDYGSPVDWDLRSRRGPFRFQGALESVRYIPGPSADYNPEIIIAIDEHSAQLLQ